MEFDDIALMFNNYDVDKSNTIDKHEAKKILFDLGMDYGAKQAEELFEIIDEVFTFSKAFFSFYFLISYFLFLFLVDFFILFSIKSLLIYFRMVVER